MNVYINGQKYLTPVEAANKAGVSVDVIRAALRSGGLNGEHISDRWYVHPDDLQPWIWAREKKEARDA